MVVLLPSTLTLLLVLDIEAQQGRWPAVFSSRRLRAVDASTLWRLMHKICGSSSSFTPDSVAEHLRHEAHQLAKTGDVRYLPGSDMLDPADHAAWQLGMHVQVHDEGAVWGQFEPARFLGRELRGTRNVPLPSHDPVIRD